MFKQISNAFLSLFLDKPARQKMAQMKASRNTGTSPITTIGSMDAVGKKMTQKRSELIRSAMDVRRKTAKILDDLEVKKKQYSTATKSVKKKNDG